MDLEPRTRQLREYLWFALILTAILMGSAITHHGKMAPASVAEHFSGQRNQQ